MASIRVTATSPVDDKETHYRNHRDLKELHLLPGAEVVSFLPLQVSLYFNVWYVPLWMVSSILSLVNKFTDLATHYKFITITIYIIMFIVELSRLYLGYEGNLREKVAELAGFWLLTLLQIPLTVYLLGNIDTIILPLERAINIVLALFLLSQLLLGFRALQLMIRAQAVKFHLTQFDRFEDTPMQTLNSKKMV